MHREPRQIDSIEENIYHHAKNASIGGGKQNLPSVHNKINYGGNHGRNELLQSISPNQPAKYH